MKLVDLVPGKQINKTSINEQEIKWNAVENAIINFLKMNTKILDKRVKDKDTDGVKGGLQSIIDGLTNAQRNLHLNESIDDLDTTLPQSVERYLDRMVNQIKGMNLNRKKEILVLARVIDAMGMDKAELMRYIQKIKQNDILNKK
jgi:hypothetical protein